MRSISGVLAGLSLAIAMTSGAFAQQQQPSAGATAPVPAPVPEQMPFDIPYGTPINLEHAKQLADAAMAEAKKHSWKMAISVVDPAGNLVFFQKIDGTQIASIQISQDKARAAAQFRRATKVFQDAIDGGHPYILSLHGVVGSEGGIPLVEGGQLIGGIGCSGGTSAQDGVACKAGADLVTAAATR
jgi:glc operon protein GlcG